jgi:hypothetical protein
MTNETSPERNLESYRNKKKHSSLYSTCIIIGVCIAIYIYVFNFDNYSETLLVQLTILWLIPIVFGYYGFIAQWMHLNFEKRQFIKPIDLLKSVSKKLPVFVIRPLFNMVHFPLFIINKSPLFIAISGSLIWCIWLLIFFVVIFPKL